MKSPSLRLKTALAALALSLIALPASADHGAWFVVENRVPVVRAERPEPPRLDWRVMTEARAMGRSDGLSQAFLRTGPLFYALDWLFIAAHGTVYADRVGDGFVQETRLELEPNAFFRWGDLTLTSRLRLEQRHRGGETRYRVRDQVRLNYAPVGARVLPFVWDEVLVDLTDGEGLNQNRASLGLGLMLTPTTRLDVGYLLRSAKRPTEWAHDHILFLQLFFDVPPGWP